MKYMAFRGMGYYAALIFLILDPLYLSVLHNFVGGGDMNGFTQMGFSPLPVSIMFLGIGVVNLFLIYKFVCTDYKKAFAQG